MLCSDILLDSERIDKSNKSHLTEEYCILVSGGGYVRMCRLVCQHDRFVLEQTRLRNNGLVGSKMVNLEVNVLQL